MSKNRAEKVALVIGIVIIVVGLVFNEFTLAYFTSDGRIDSNSQKLLIRLFNASFIVAGALTIIFRKRKIVHNLMIMGIVTLVMLAILDRMIYFISPMLSSDAVLALSPKAQIRYIESNPESSPWVYEDNIRYGRPNSVMPLFDFEIQFDELGYRNPPDYFGSEQPIGILILGDSFIWGTTEVTIAESMRETLDPLTVYSAGVPGSGIAQWKYHYRRVVDNMPSSESPDIVVLNFYSGNDLEDTQVFVALQNQNEVVDSTAYYTYTNYQYLLPTDDRRFTLQFPELVFVANYAMAVARSSGQQQQERLVQLDSEAIPIHYYHREPHPEAIRELILDQIAITIDAIHEENPDAIIVFSYIAPGSVIYGDRIIDCFDCNQDIENQRINSGNLAEFVTGLGVEYVDVMPEMQEMGGEEMLWSQTFGDDHFSPRGYELYAQLLSTEIERSLAEVEN